METTLPKEHSLGDRAIANLARALDETAASYKFLWTLAILEEVEKTGETIISTGKLASIMLRKSVVPINRFKLNFGFHDRAAERLKNLASMISLDTGEIRPDLDTVAGRRGVDENVHRIQKEMRQKVPHRWLQPFFDQEKPLNPTRTESVVRRAITQFAEKAYETREPPPYKLGDGVICLHPLWRDYFKRNASIIRGWCLWRWAHYLRARNPNIPSIVNKIGFPESRGQWQQEQKFWQMVIERAPRKVRCLYSKNVLDPANFHLDHYIPWSFIGHNRPWNIAPVTQEANVKKGDKLPHHKYFPDFLSLQKQAIRTWKKHAPGRFAPIVEAYRVDLQLTKSQLVQPTPFGVALKRTMLPIIETAKNNDFESGWRYR